MGCEGDGVNSCCFASPERLQVLARTKRSLLAWGQSANRSTSASKAIASAWRKRLRNDSNGQRAARSYRSSPGRSARAISGKLRDIDRRIADIEHHATTENRSLAREIENLR